jgi:hypothetical protein
MKSRPIAAGVIFFAALAGMVVLSTQPACLPDKTCFGDKVNVLIGDGGTDPRATGCTSCMQQTKCCDVLGACGDDQHCSDEFERMQACMIERGASREAECRQELVGVASKDLYACVRTPCGKSCGIPNCDLNAAVTLFVNSTCDHCIGTACCEQVNRCYGNRQCKLFLECVSDHCPRTVGTGMTRIGDADPALLDAFEAAVCGDAGAATAFPQGSFDPGACLNRCLREYAAPPDGLPEENQAASCLAVGVYACGARNRCGPACSQGGSFEVGEYAEDDAGSDASAPTPDAGTD